MIKKRKKAVDQTKYWACADKERLPLLLFLQRAQEILLYSSSMLVRKKYASPHSILVEILFLLNQHKLTPHSSTETNVAFLIDEFFGSLRNDSVARFLIGDRYDFFKNAFSEKGNINLQIEVAEFSLARLGQSRYLSMCMDKITNIIESGGKEKNLLLELTDSFIFGVRDAGYPAQTVIHLLNVAFLDKKRKPVSAQEMLGQFASYFDLKKHPFRIYFAASEVRTTDEIFASVPAEYLPVDSPDAIKFIKNLPASTKRFFSALPMDGIIVMSEVTDLDPQSARQRAERRIRLLDDLLRFSAHRPLFKINNPALICRADTGGRHVHSNRPKAAVLRMPDASEVDGAELKSLTSVGRFTNRASLGRFIRAVELHGTALSAPEEESQLLNLWIAFETLFVTGANGSKISEVLSCVMPYISAFWIGYEFQEMWAQIVDKHSDAWSAAINGSQLDEKFKESLAFTAAVALKKYEPEMTRFLKELDGDPLLRCRICSCIAWAQDPKKIENYINEVETRIGFDINRVYRYRNHIVHVGEADGDIGQVVQCAHHYLDVVLNVLALVLGRSGGPRTIEQANMEVKIKIKNQRNSLADAAKAEGAIGDDTFLHLLIGRPLLE